MTNTEICRAAQCELFANAQLKLADDLLAPDFVDHAAPPGAPQGPEGAKATVRWLHSAFSDIAYDVEDTIAEGDRVVLRVTMRGTHTGDFLGRPASGNRFAAAHVHVFRVADERIAEHWAVRDDLAMMRQLEAAA